MAGGIARRLAEDMGLSNIEFASTGTLGLEGLPATDEAIAVCREIGVDISYHRSRAITSELLNWADLVFGTEAAHLDFVRRHWQNTKAVLKTLAEEDIADPLGMDISAYRTTREIIFDNIYKILEGIKCEKEIK